MEWAVNTSMTLTDHVSATFKRMARGADHFGDETDKAFRRASISSSRFGDIVKGVLTAGAIENGIRQIGELASETVTVAREADALATAYDSVFEKQAGEQMRFVRQESERLGTAFKESAESYMQIAAAAKGTSISNEQVQNTFRGVSEAAAALQLDGEKVEGALTAISQMISKGKVSAEELRGQLGERIPGAFQIAARAMNMTTAELDKTMSTGNLMAEDFLPSFAKQLRKEFGAGAEAASNSFGAMNRKFDNSMREMKVALGSVFLPALTELMVEVRPVIKSVTQWISANDKLLKQKISGFIQGLTSAAKTAWPVISGVASSIGTLSGWVYALRGPLVALTIAFVAFKTIMGAMAIISTVTTMITTLQGGLIMAGGAMSFFNAVLLANPIMWIVGAIALMVGAIAAAIIYWDEITAAVKGFLGLSSEAGDEMDSLAAKANKAGAAAAGSAPGGSQAGAAGPVAGIPSMPGIPQTQSGEPGGSGLPSMPGRPQISAPTPESQTQKMKLEFYGRIDVYGLPEQSEYTRTGGNAPDVDVKLLGANK